MSIQKTIAHDLLSIGAVFLRPDDPFTWASGIKSPIYCDNRLTLTAPAVFTLLYAISDEIHQIFSGRGPRVTDVLIDFSGAVCGILLIHGIAYLIARRKKGSKSAAKKKRRRRNTPCEIPATD